MKQIITNSVEETMALGFKIGQIIERPQVIFLNGDIGLGKTMITKGIAKGLGIEDTITSPTFTIVKEYDGLIHVDAYRFESANIDSVGLTDFLNDDNVVIIEWANYIEGSGIVADITIDFEYLDENQRLLTIEGVNV